MKEEHTCRENFLDRYTRSMDVIARSGWEGEYIPLGAVSLPFLGHVSGDFTISSKRLGKKIRGMASQTLSIY